MPQLPQRLGLNLPDALTSDGKRLAHFLECMLAAVVQPKAHLDNLFFARREGLEHRRRLFLKVQVNDRVRGRHNSLVLDEIAQMRIFLFPNRGFQ